MTTREQGDLGESSAIDWLTRAGAVVAFPLTHSPDWDIIAETDGRLLRVQVKTCTQRYRRGWAVALCTRGGNRSWNGIAKRLDASRCDYVFVLVADGRRWFIPATALGGGTAIVVGNAKYREFEIERGQPLPDRTRAKAAI
jgi:Holliday junction resolvase-like predicted endonuclease